MQHPDLAVVATQLAATDRRALSQAWYSALHLAERAAPARKPRLASAGGASSAAPQARRGGTGALGTGAAHRDPPATRSSARSEPQPGAAERRAPKTELVRRLESALTRRRSLDGGAAFVVRAGTQRVHVLVRCAGARTCVVAVCSPALRERVERALAQARFALAGRGAVVEAA